MTSRNTNEPSPNATECLWTAGWWEDAFIRAANASERKGHPRGDKRMLIVIAYDITSPKRLKKAANCCKDFGVRVQKSVFECRLEADQFERFWTRLTGIADPDEDSLVAYPLAGSEARKIRTHGIMVCSEQVVAYIF